MNISLTPYFEEMIRKKIASGSYGSASEVVQEAMRLLDLKDQLFAVSLIRLRRDIREGMDSGPSEPFEPGKIKRKARKKIKARRIR